METAHSLFVSQNASTGISALDKIWHLFLVFEGSVEATPMAVSACPLGHCLYPSFGHHSQNNLTESHFNKLVSLLIKMSLPLSDKWIPSLYRNPQSLKSIFMVMEAKTLLATTAMQPDVDMCDIPGFACSSFWLATLSRK